MDNKFNKPVNFNSKNYAFIDGQNLYMGIAKSTDSWQIDLARFRVYLRDKYKIKYAYYFLGYKSRKYVDLYKEITEAGFILKFKQHGKEMVSSKKGNIDSDMIFVIMKKVFTENKVDQIIIVSGDGDFKILVDFLIRLKKFKKVLFPNRKYASSLYKMLSREYHDYVENYRMVIQNKKDLKH